ncbi:MAG TPA: helix-turn-helix domain-containing protein, partial [Chloroflexota bacterium]
MPGDLSSAQLRRRRQAVGLTQAQLAKRLGISATVVARWERGALRISQVERVLSELARPREVLATLPPSNLPRELTSFVGRERQIAAVGLELLERRLLTLTGPGGVGKTRLALEVAEQLRPQFADGVHFVSLAALTDASMVGLEGDVVQLVGRLVDRSLVVAEELAGEVGEMRYRLLETLRQYAAEQLDAAGELAELRERHRAWCLGVAENGEREIWRAEQVRCVERLARENDNVRAGLGWTLSLTADDPEIGLRTAAAMVRFWDVHGDLREGIRWLDDLLRLPGVRPQTLGWARALSARAYLATLAGHREQGIQLLDQSLPFWRALPDTRGLAVALFFRGFAVAWTGTDLRASAPALEESLGFARQRGPRWTVYFCLYCLGEVARSDGDLARADALFSESLSLATDAQDRWGAFHAHLGLAFLALGRGETTAAEEHASRGLTLSLELGDSRGSTYALEALGCIAAEHHDARRVARVFGAAQALREPLGDFQSVTALAARELALATIHARLGDAAFEAALAAGRRLGLEEAVALARGMQLDERLEDGLTAREHEVARLVARGMSNREIATALVTTVGADHREPSHPHLHQAGVALA